VSSCYLLLLLLLLFIFNCDCVYTLWQQYSTHCVDTRWQQYSTHCVDNRWQQYSTHCVDTRWQQYSTHCVDTRWQQYSTNWVDTWWQQHSTHLHTNSTQNIESGTYITIKRRKNGKCGPCHVFASYTLAFALQLRKNHEKTLVRIVEMCPDIPVAVVQYTFTHKQYTEQHGTKTTRDNYVVNSTEITAVCVHIQVRCFTI
jgi:hypothetical protein